MPLAPVYSPLITSDLPWDYCFQYNYRCPGKILDLDVDVMLLENRGMERPQLTLSEYRALVSKIYERITKGKALPNDDFGIAESCYEGGMIENSAAHLIWYAEVVGLTDKALWYASELRNSNEDFLSRLAFYRSMKGEINRTRRKDDSGWLFEFTIVDFKKKLKELLAEHVLEETEETIDDPEQIVICRRCGSFKPKDGFCPECGSGWAGKRLSEKIIAGLRDLARRESLSFDAIVRKTAICRKCGSLRTKDAACPICGSKSPR